MRRLLLATAIATIAACGVYYRLQSGEHTDFSLSWFGGRMLLDHRDPYPLVGPGRDLPFRWRFPNLYPATAFVTAMPVALFPEALGNALFIWVSIVLLIYGMTARSWHLLPLIASLSFVLNVQRVQWTILTTAMLFLPAAAVFTVAKPQFGFAAIAAAEKSSTWRAAIIGGAVVTAISLVFLPSWPLEWLSLLRNNTEHLHAPITRPLGFLIPIVLIKWKERDAWFVFILSCMPQTWDYYNTLPLLALATSYREACVLSVLSSLGGFIWIWLWVGPSVARTTSQFTLYSAALIVLFAYLPAAAAILLRRDAGTPPFWLRVKNVKASAMSPSVRSSLWAR